MSSTYTSLLRLTLPTTGELTGTWGNTVNTGITALIENALAGRVTVTHSNAADYTLTTANGSTDEARYMVLNITGTLTAARNVVCPTSSKVYIVQNNTTGGYAITVKTAAGTGISVANGATEFLMCDGTNVIRVLATGTFTNLTTGTLTVTGNTTLGDASGDTLTIAPNAVTWSNNPTHSGNHTFSGNVTIQGNTAIGDAAGDTLTFASSTVTWNNNPTHSGTHTFTTTVNVSGTFNSNGSTNIGDSSGDSLTIAPAAVTWSGNPTHTGTHTFSTKATGVLIPSSVNGTPPTAGKITTINADFTVNTGTAGDIMIIYNPSNVAKTLTQGAGVTLRLCGTATTGNRTIPQYGRATLYYYTTGEVYLDGVGVT